MLDFRFLDLRRLRAIVIYLSTCLPVYLFTCPRVYRYNARRLRAMAPGNRYVCPQWM